MRILFITLFIFPGFISASAQNYTRDAGVRLGSTMSLSYRQHNYDDTAYEFFAGYHNRGFRFAALKEFFRPAFLNTSDNLTFCMGFGAHAGISYSDKYSYFNRNFYRDSWVFSPIFGLDGLFGLEYEIQEFPVLLGLETMPFFEFSADRFFYLEIFNISFSMKYRF
ncbi:MAG: hypothetical protein JXJ22_02470 [Bacteroidales bacterium]|nr:hypothetical protein [Bacteroidales bacterium]